MGDLPKSGKPPVDPNGSTSPTLDASATLDASTSLSPDTTSVKEPENSPWADLTKVDSSPSYPSLTNPDLKSNSVDEVKPNATAETMAKDETSNDQPKNKPRLNNLAGVLIIFFLATGLVASYFLMQESQDTRQQASSGVGASCYVGSQPSPPFDKKSCNCNGTNVWFDNTGYCGDKAASGETTSTPGTAHDATYGLCAVYYKYGCTNTGSPNDPPGSTNYAGCWTCTSSGCSIKSGPGYEHCAANCQVWKWKCDRIDNLSGGCQDGTPSVSSSQSFSANCGAEQIDVTCGGQSRDFRSRINDQPCTTTTTPPPTTTTPPPTVTPTPTPTPTPPPVLVCADIEMLDATGNTMTEDDDKDLRDGDQVRFRANHSGSATGKITYEFRILAPNTSTWTNLTNADASVSAPNVSAIYTIVSSGEHVAQARVCLDGQCQSWETIN